MTAENIIVGEPVYIVGHKKPDLDAIISAYAYQVYRHARGDFNYLAIRCDEVNPLTAWVFKDTKHNLPPLVKNIAGRKIVLVDHTDPEQRADGWEEADIVEVVDHHKLKLETSAPAKITVRPYGSTTTMIAEKLIRHSVNISPEFAQLMLSSILDDTLALRSPITTYMDKSIAGKLAAISGLEDIDAYAKKMFGKKDSWHLMKADRIVESDSKEYEMSGLHVHVSQIETLDSKKLAPKFKEIHKYLEKKKKDLDADLVVALVTDIIKVEARVIAVGDHLKDLEEIFGGEFENGIMLVKGLQSRKKEFIPKVEDFYKAKRKK